MFLRDWKDLGNSENTTGKWFRELTDIQDILWGIVKGVEMKMKMQYKKVCNERAKII